MSEAAGTGSTPREAISFVGREANYMAGGVVGLHGAIGYWRSVRTVLAATWNWDSYAREVLARYGGYSRSLLERTVPWDWYRRDARLDRNGGDHLWLGGSWWSRSVTHDAALSSLNYVYRETRASFGLVDSHAPRGVEQYPVYSGNLFQSLNGVRDGLLRLVGGIIAALSLMLVRVLAALSQRINATTLVLLLIATCQRFGRRDEPGDDASLLARRQLSLPGRVPAM